MQKILNPTGSVFRAANNSANNADNYPLSQIGGVIAIGMVIIGVAYGRF